MLRAELETGVIFSSERHRFRLSASKNQKKQLLMRTVTGLTGSSERRRFFAVSDLRLAG
jgi:hypothetical protein